MNNNHNHQSENQSTTTKSSLNSGTNNNSNPNIRDWITMMSTNSNDDVTTVTTDNVNHDKDAMREERNKKSKLMKEQKQQEKKNRQIKLNQVDASNNKIPLKLEPDQKDIDANRITGNCNLWMVNKRKHRAHFCTQPIAKGQTLYCTMHKAIDASVTTTSNDSNDQMTTDGNNNNTQCNTETTTSTSTQQDKKKRIPCPIDSTHTIYASNLKKHLKGCPSLKDTQKNAHIRVAPSKHYYCENINGEQPIFNNTLLAHIDTNQLQAIALKLESIFTHLYPNGIETNNHLHSSLESISKVNAVNKIKHIQQESSILSIIEKEGLLSKDNIYIEFGAGSGKLGHHVFSALDKQSGHIMIDRMKFKSLKKVDRLIKHEKSCSYFDRLLIDIRHLDLSKIDILHSKDFVVISKHLCGCATDFTLQCLSNAFKNNENLRKHFKGISIATCCHHVCTFNSYSNTKFITEELKLSQDEFRLLTSISSWATINEKQIDKSKQNNQYNNSNNDKVQTTTTTTTTNTTNNQDSDDDDDDQQQLQQQDLKNQFIDPLVNYEHVFQLDKKEALGYMAKRILDYGRYLFIKESLLQDCNLQIYTSLSKENMLISGTGGKNH